MGRGCNAMNGLADDSSDVRVSEQSRGPGEMLDAGLSMPRLREEILMDIVDAQETLLALKVELLA